MSQFKKRKATHILKAILISNTNSKIENEMSKQKCKIPEL